MNTNTSRVLKALTIIGLLLSTFPVMAQEKSRGIGIYPGAPEEFFGPQLVDSKEYRNVARGRIVYQSSAFDFNMTAQLLTDGIVEKKGITPVFLEVTTPDGQLSQRQRESTIDGNDWTRSIVMGEDTWLQYGWHGMTIRADAIRLIGTVAYREGEATDGYRIRVMISKDGRQWQEVAHDESRQLLGKRSWGMVHSDPNKNDGNDNMLPTRRIEMDFPFGQAQSFSYLRVELLMKGAVYWTFTENPITLDGRQVENLLPSSGFTSAWMTVSDRDEWACIDLGAPADISKVNLHWIEKPQRFEVQLSDDGEHFTTSPLDPQGRFRSIAEKEPPSLRGRVGVGLTPSKARYVRVFIPSTGKTQRVVLSEIEVMGRGGLVAKPNQNNLPPYGGGPGWGSLNGGDWRLQRASQVKATGAQISSKGFDTSSWTVATVPATVLMSYVNAGALPNPNYDDNLMLTSESFFNSNFWYRREFSVPAEMLGQRIFLNFDGINWKANIWLNGQKVDRVEGAFMRGKTDITRYLHDGVNVLAVEIEKCAHPGSAKLKNEQTTDYNGGLLGADNPTFHATVGWDWISSIRGRDIGIWDDVYLTASPSGLTLSDPVVNSKITINGTDTLATMMPTVVVANNTDQQQKTVLSGWIGQIRFEKEITLAAGEEREVSFNPSEYAQLNQQRMHLWWPAGYGEPYLYDAGFEVNCGGSLSYKAGIREVTYDEVATRLQVFVNGVRFVPMGGNWGFSENNLCYRGREYDAAVRYHRNMHLNCIRNWVGQIGDREFYEACDRYGVMVWQDFWLANPADGPDPYDNDLFLRNARDYVLRIRQHPCIMLFCGRNEGYPPKELDDGLRQLVSELTGLNAAEQPLNFERAEGALEQTTPKGCLYISSSADDGVSGHGPYWAIPAKEYYQRQTGKLHSERGMPNIMTYEGLARTLRPEHLWPQSHYWGQHDFTQEGAQRGASFNQLIARAFGEPKDAREFTTLAQWLNYDGYRAMYESTNHDRQGLLIWMSHPTWPSMVWQTYDYYFEPIAGYFGTKKACEPLHIQWNPLTDSVEVVNTGAGRNDGIAIARLLDMHGVEIWHNDRPFRSDNDTTIACFPIEVPKNYQGVYFLSLEALYAIGKSYSQNTYVCSTDTGNYQALKTLPQVKLKVTKQLNNNESKMLVTLENPSFEPALMIRLNLKTDDGEQVLPVLYDDNYFHLMPGEKRVIQVEWNPRDARGEIPDVEISGYNVPLCR
ncbi:MAG: discoidin domain-containing protein [Prevotella sp.]|nr:discoidin domain-containing protein [Prevotella sp.]